MDISKKPDNPFKEVLQNLMIQQVSMNFRVKSRNFSVSMPLFAHSFINFYIFFLNQNSSIMPCKIYLPTEPNAREKTDT